MPESYEGYADRSAFAGMQIGQAVAPYASLLLSDFLSMLMSFETGLEVGPGKAVGALMRFSF
jgi:hypothetical protein